MPGRILVRSGMTRAVPNVMGCACVCRISIITHEMLVGVYGCGDPLWVSCEPEHDTSRTRSSQSCNAVLVDDMTLWYRYIPVL